jgi:hypothetical protein
MSKGKYVSHIKSMKKKAFKKGIAIAKRMENPFSWGDMVYVIILGFIIGLYLCKIL